MGRSAKPEALDLYEEYELRIRSIVRQKVAGETNQEDLIQDIWEAILLGSENLRSCGNPAKWILGLVRNKIVDHYRRARRRSTEITLTFDDECTPAVMCQAGFTDELELEDWCSLGLSRLPSHERRLLYMVWVLGYKPAEMATSLPESMSPKWIRQTLHRAKMRFLRVVGAATRRRTTKAGATTKLRAQGSDGEKMAPDSPPPCAPVTPLRRRSARTS